MLPRAHRPINTSAGYVIDLHRPSGFSRPGTHIRSLVRIAAMDTKILIQHPFFNVEKSSTHPMKPKIYEGIHNQEQAMTPTANIIRDAWVFGIIPEDETCEGWTIQGIDALYDKVTAAWQPYGHLVSNLPPELRERHARIYAEAIERARATGWDPELDETD
jgi:hypothetical protein